MNIWKVTLECADWANPWQTVMVATESMNVEEAIKVTNDNFITGLITGINHVGFAHLPKAPDPNESA